VWILPDESHAKVWAHYDILKWTEHDQKCNSLTVSTFHGSSLAKELKLYLELALSNLVLMRGEKSP
jgi:histidinol dehydrogenase